MVDPIQKWLEDTILANCWETSNKLEDVVKRVQGGLDSLIREKAREMVLAGMLDLDREFRLCIPKPKE